jgi:hypothetical protein
MCIFAEEQTIIGVAILWPAGFASISMGVELKKFTGTSFLATKLCLTCDSVGDPLQITTSKHLLRVLGYLLLLLLQVRSLGELL